MTSASPPISLSEGRTPGLRQYRIVKILQDGTYEAERGKPRDFNHLISEGWEVGRVLNWTDLGGNLLFSRPRPAGYEAPAYRLPGHPFAGR